ncbi:DUF3363 domain-containing protein [Variovorax sp.]|uniref:DUF3363 domain-containing protein n=1 Tax=Variovorax sp. TaxID=1871043 RepID=UPI0037D9C5D8
MSDADDERFRPRPSAPRSRTTSGEGRFVSRVVREASRAGARAGSALRKGSGRDASSGKFGRGRVAAALGGSRLGRQARRVVIKSRFVVLRKASPRSVAMHLRYIERDGVTRDGQRGQAYDVDTDKADLRDFEERGRGDRHQFRFIVSVEDAPQLEDLHGFTRELMQRMGKDLETPLDWVAVDHWDTDNPHTHVVLRGRIGDGPAGRDLVIAPAYMAHGMRVRASGIATEWLGPRTELEIRQGLEREVAQDRLTSLDRTLLRQAPDQMLDLRGSRASAQSQALLRARLQRLEAMGLARPLEAHRWRLEPTMERALTELGDRGDILRTVQRALRGERRELDFTAQAQQLAIVGRIVTKGMIDELHERCFVVLDGVDGRAHYLKLPAGFGASELRDLPEGGIGACRPAAPRRVDAEIAAAAKEGLYNASAHRAQLERAGDPRPAGTLEVHERRLEALRRGGVVERQAEGIWKIPPSLAERALAHDARAGAGIELLSHLGLERQVRAVGATWLDQVLVKGEPLRADAGFGAEVDKALRERQDYLVEQGLGARDGVRFTPARDLLRTLRDRELAEVGRVMQARSGRAYRPLEEGRRIDGVYRRRLDLASGRFVVLDDGLGFSLVPWRAVVEARRGMQVSAVVRAGTVSWQLQRQRGLGV